MSFPTSPTIGQIAKLVSTGPDYIYRGLGKWDVLAMDPNFDPSGYVTTAVYAPAKAIQDAAIAAAASVAASAGTVAAAAIPAAQKAAVNGVASLDGSGHVPDAQNKPLWASVQSKPSTFPPDTHTHDDRYYTKTQTDGLVSRAGGINPVTDWDGAIAGINFGDNALHGPEASGQFVAEVWAVDADTAIARAVGLDGNNYVYQRAKTGGVWETSWTLVSDANGTVWHPGNMPAAQALWDDNTPNTLVKRGSTGNIKAPFGVFAGEIITTAPATIAIQSGTDGTIRWQALAKLTEHIAAQASFSGPLASIAAKVGDVRLGASVSVGDAFSSGHTVSAGAGRVLQQITYSSSGNGNDVLITGIARPVQKYVSDSWVTVSQA